MAALAAAGGVIVVLVAALVFVVWRVLAAEAPRRSADHAFLLSVLQVRVARSVAEAAQADVIRDSAKRAEDLQDGVASYVEAEVKEQNRQGHVGEIALARALMVKSGLDPDKDDDVTLYNARMRDLVQ